LKGRRQGKNIRQKKNEGCEEEVGRGGGGAEEVRGGKGREGEGGGEKEDKEDGIVFRKEEMDGRKETGFGIR
jgi:hypothetical protein